MTRWSTRPCSSSGCGATSTSSPRSSANSSASMDRSPRVAPDQGLPAAPGQENLPGVLGRIQRLSARRGLGWLDTAARVQARVAAENGNYLAGAISLAAFLALFPILLLALSI